jgi:hypothetical protein
MNKYADLRGRYTPEHPKIIFVLESPPVSGKYFYDPDGFTTEPLFSGMMKDVLELSPKTKHEGLIGFTAHDYLLLDATYTPVNIPGNKNARNKASAKQNHQGLPAAPWGTAQAHLSRYATGPCHGKRPQTA